MPKLGVNIDHVATVREARRTFEPDPVLAAIECEKAGADAIVCHLRKDRRHINDDDLAKLKKTVRTYLNLEMSVDPEIVDIACRIKPNRATLVPENRQEITTEGGLDVMSNLEMVKEVAEKLSSAGIEVSLFIDPEQEQMLVAKKTSAAIVEFHTGRFSIAFNSRGDWQKELKILADMVESARRNGLTVAAGHGLNYENVGPVAGIDGVHELNIGHSIISKAVFVGIGEAVREMKELIK